MMSVDFAAASRGRLSARAFALVGTSLGCSLLLPSGAFAQNVYSSGTTDYSLTSTDTISGGPRAVDIMTSGGNVTLNLATVNSDNGGTALGTAIAGNNTGNGNVSITSGTATASGTGQSYAIDARTATGDIIINAGTTTANGNATSRGIYAITGSGDITIAAGETNGGARAIYTGFNGDDGPNVTTITSQNATTNGTTSTDTILGQGNTVNITSGTASNINPDAYQGATIFSNAGTGGTTIIAGTTNALGQGQAAIQAFSEGAVSITSDTVNTTQNSDGITVESGTVIDVGSKTITTLGNNARGIVLGGADGGGGFNGGVDGIPYTSASITSGTITTAGTDSYGIYVTPTAGTAATSGATTITSDTIKTAGTGATGILVTGIGAGVVSAPTTITSNAITTSGNNALGISVKSTDATTITSTNIATTGTGASGIYVQSPGATTINGGAITVAGANAIGIDVNAGASSTGAVTIASNSISQTGAGGTGIYVSAGTGAVGITTGTIDAVGRAVRSISSGATTVDVTGDLTSHALNAISVTAGNFAITTGAGTTVTASGGTSAIAGGASTGNGIVTNNGTVAATGATESGIGITTLGNATVVSNAITVAGTTAPTSGLAAAGISAVSSGTGNVSVTSDSVAVNGAGRYGIYAATSTSGAGTVTIASTTASSTSDNDATIRATSGAGAIAITSGTVSSTGVNGNGISAQSTSGAVTVTSDTISTSGTTAHGIQVSNTTGPVSITSTGTLATSGANAMGIYAVNTGGAVTIDAANVSTADASAIVVNPTSGSTGAITVDAGIVRATGSTQPAINLASNTIAGPITVSVADSISLGSGVDARSTGAVSVTGGTVQTTGAGAFGLNAISYADSATVNSTTLSVNDGRGIFAQGAGDTAVTSSTLTTTGADYDYALIAQNVGSAGNAGAIKVNSGTLTSGAGGINAYTSGTDTVTINATTTTGATSDAIVGSGSGNVTIVSGTATTGGVNGSSVAGVSYGGGAVSVTSGTAMSTAAASRGVFNVGGISSGTGGTVTVHSGSSSISGAGTTAVYGSADGDVTITSGTATALGGTAIDAESANGLATVTATTASGGTGVYASGGSGVVLNIGSASSTNDTAAGAALYARGDAIVATATNGSILATIGSASATGAGSDAVHLVADGTGGAVTANITGTISSASGNGVFIDPPGAVVVNVGSGASISGGTAGIDATGGTNSITNAGTISSATGPGILASGTTTLVDSGTIVGANGVAVQLGAANDTVTLQTGAAITGRINGGGGTDAAILSGTNAVATGTQTIAGFTGFDSLTVQSGYWTAQATNASSFNSATIDRGASLQVANGTAGISGVTAPAIIDNGNLVVASSAASGGSTFGSTVVSGSGNVLFTGAGTATLDGTNSIATTGTITVDGGSTLQVTGTQGGTVVAGSGGTLVVGNGGTTGTLTGSVVDNGKLVYDRSDDTTFAAALSGTGNFVKAGAGKLTFGSDYAFTGTTTIEQGAIRLSTPIAATSTIDLEGAGELDLSGSSQQIAQLSGSSTTASINIAGGALTVDQATTTSFAGSITGNGSLTKTGSGSLNLTGVNTYTGPTTIDGGRLAVNGSITSPVTVNAGGILGGNGSIGTVAIASGGTYAPGNSIGTQTVNGNVTFSAGSIYEVQADAAGQADRVNATGTATLSGGTVEVLAAAGSYSKRTDYTILTAAGGISGRFANVTSNMAFLSPLLTYGTGAVTLTLLRNDLAFGAIATSPRELAVANAIAARGAGDTIYNTVLFDSTSAAQQTFNQLSGELHASLPSELADSGRRVRDAILNHLTPDEGLGVWGQGLQSYSSSRAQAGLDQINANRTGAVGGVDFAHEGMTLGLLAGYLDDQVNITAAGSHARINMKFVGATASYTHDALMVRAGATFAWQNINTQRQITAPGLAGTLSASPHANTAQIFGEVGYALTHGPVTLTPFVRNAFNWTRVKAFNEIGGIAALSVQRDSRDTDFLSAGIHMTGTAPVSAHIALLPKITVSYEHGFGDLNGASVAQIGGTGPSFTITGARLGRDTLNVDTGFDLLFGQKFSVGASGFASTSSQWSDHGVKASVTLRF